MQIDKLFQILFSEQFKHRFETIIIYLSVGGFLLHLALIGLHHLDIFTIRSGSDELFEKTFLHIKGNNSLDIVI